MQKLPLVVTDCLDIVTLNIFKCGTRKMYLIDEYIIQENLKKQALL